MDELRGRGGILSVLGAPEAEEEPEVGDGEEPLEAGGAHVDAVPVEEAAEVVDLVAGLFKHGVDDGMDTEQRDLECDHGQPGEPEQAGFAGGALVGEQDAENEEAASAEIVQ